MQILDHHATEQALEWHAMADALRDVLLAQAQGKTQCPVRSRVDLAGARPGILLTMPAADHELAVVKVVTVHTDNVEVSPSLPVVQAAVLVLDARTGERLALLDGEIVTARRTAALSALAVQIARQAGKARSDRVHVVGNGAQARAHLDAFQTLLGTQSCTVTARSKAGAESLLTYARALGYRASAAQPPDAIHADIIVTATSSPVPVLHEPVEHEAVICAVGAFTRTMAEIAPDLVRRCTVAVDTIEGCHAEAGDLIQAEVDWEAVTPLHGLKTTEIAADRPLLFKSVGSALWDLAAARCWARARGILS